MGVMFKGETCSYCNQGLNECPGHFGYINLGTEIFHPGQIKTIVGILNSICPDCSRLKLSPHDGQWLKELPFRTRRGQRIESFAVRLRGRECPYCQNKRKQEARGDKDHNVVRLTIKFEEEKERQGRADVTSLGVSVREESLTARRVIEIFRKMQPEDLDILGLDPHETHPQHLILTEAVVVPPIARPSVKERGLRHDQLFTLYSDILKAASKDDMDARSRTLADHIRTYFDNSGKTGVQEGGVDLKGIKQRLQGKYGRIRGNLMGKRVNYCARSVITGDPTISIDEVGVPRSVAKHLTFPETVTPRNIDFLQRRVGNGLQYPGATTVWRKANNRQERIDHFHHRETKLAPLAVGDIVERHLEDGDMVCFNRQPSLHKMSFMGHKVKVLPYSTFRLNLSVTAPYNADFDGDEMNFHVPQSLEAVAEVKNIMLVPNQIINPKSNSPIISIVQDSLLGCYLITQRDVFLTRERFMNLMMFLSGRKIHAMPQPAVLFPEELWTGKQLFSLIIPDVITLSFRNKLQRSEEFGKGNPNPPDDSRVLIRSGQVLMGVCNKVVVGSSHGSLIHILWKDLSPEAARSFLNGCQRLVNAWLKQNSFSVGIMDMVTRQETQHNVRGALDKVQDELEKVYHDALCGRLELAPGETMEDAFEKKVNNELTNVNTELAGHVFRDMHRRNAMLCMVQAGSKGKPFNISQISAAVGQQNLEGKRMRFRFRTNRTLPHYTAFAFTNWESRGFVRSSFMRGLHPTEFYFHAVGGREGLSDTAVKSVTGDTRILIVEGGHAKVVEIGPWINRKIMRAPPGAVRVTPEDANIEELALPEGSAFVPSTDEDGTVTWKPITAVNRHDPGQILYDVVTEGGRHVTVTAAKGLLVYNPATDKIEPRPPCEVRAGERLPVTSKLPLYDEENPITEVDVSHLFPKTEYVHRAGCVYPIVGSSRDSHISTTLTLDRNTGMMIGYYLSEGHGHEGKAISIANNSRRVQRFIMEYFRGAAPVPDPHNGLDDPEVDGPVSPDRGDSTFVNSSILSRMYCALFGENAENKKVPGFVYQAPEEFRQGLLSAYFIGDGTLDLSNISFSTASPELTEAIEILCNMAEAFGKASVSPTKGDFPALGRAYRGRFAKRLAEVVDLTHMPEKERSRLALIERIGGSDREEDGEDSFPEFEHVVLDSIESITEVTGLGHRYMYDISVPGTLNFALANGLHVRDTSSTGYLHRRLMKAMENINIRYDGTVRNAQNDILQFRYGDDNLDPLRVETDTFQQLVCSDHDFKKSYIIDWLADNVGRGWLHPSVIREVREPGVRARLQEEKDIILADRNWHRHNASGKGRSARRTIAVNVRRLLRNAELKSSEGLSHSAISRDARLCSLSPRYVLEQTKQLMESIQDGEEAETRLLVLLLRTELSVKQICKVRRLTREAFDELITRIDAEFKRAHVHPGEPVGPIAASAISEPATQLSIPGDTSVIVRLAARPAVVVADAPVPGLSETESLLAPEPRYEADTVKIGDFIDKLMIDQAVHVVSHNLGTGGPSSILDILPGHGIQVPALGADEEMHWRDVRQVSRHPPNGPLIQFTTNTHREITATPAHSFVIRRNHEVVSVAGRSLKVGDRIPFMFSLNWDGAMKETLPMDQIFNKEDIWFGSELHKARESFSRHGAQWQHHMDDYVVPVGPDALRLARRSKMSDGYIYPKHYKRMSLIPELWPLDRLTGWFFGAYLAEGYESPDFVSITNNDEDYCEKVAEFARRFNLGTTVVENDTEGGLSTSVIINSQLLSKVMLETCGRLAIGKHVPGWVIGCSDEFISSLLRAFIDGDGGISVDRGIIRTHSVSVELLRGISALLSRFGIWASIVQDGMDVDGTPIFVLSISAAQAQLHKDTIGIKVKQCGQSECHDEHDQIPITGDVLRATCEQLYKLTGNMKFNSTESLSTAISQFQEHGLIGRSALKGCIKTFDAAIAQLAVEQQEECDISVLKRAANSHVVWDKITRVEMVESTTEFVYDFAVDEDETFTLGNGLITHNTLNTFHLAGHGAVNVTLGIPRLREIVMSAAKSIKTPMMKLPIKGSKPDSRARRAARISALLRRVPLAELVTRVRIRETVQAGGRRYAVELELPEIASICREYGLSVRIVRRVIIREFTAKLHAAISGALKRRRVPSSVKEGEEEETVAPTAEAAPSVAEKSAVDDESSEGPEEESHAGSEEADSGSEETSVGAIDAAVEQWTSELDEELKRMRDGIIARTECISIQFLQTPAAPVARVVFQLGLEDRLLMVSLAEAVTREVVVKAVKGVTRCFTTETDDHTIVQTDGCNLLSVRLMSPDIIAFDRLETNNIAGILDTYGVEAARAAIINEVHSVFSVYHISVSHRHLSVIADFMTHDGGYRAFNRIGIADLPHPLLKTSFETSTKFLADAAMHSVPDRMSTPSASITVGQRPKIGTGAFQILQQISIKESE
eukprot:gnl/Dysnectes_brevis/1028_a1146_1678.p1 GENE.gnl/Dysnectes_brevis/1028_a1146_1678~~gnl/Dysnectes_brevis/1028_a1146_1678.p1  ORF type:complete len:2444 (+),score=361.56 gnl/Dysnectes_brevis/1028_a1146_1678:176-7507(+)